MAGDSWGIGVYKLKDNEWTSTGQGIQSLLESYGHTVVNISKGGGSNWLMIDRLNDRWDNFSRCLYGVAPNERKEIRWNQIDHVVYLQTDIFRENFLYVEENGWQKQLDANFITKLLEYNTLQQFIDEYFINFYTELNSIGKTHNKKILCLGCWSKLHPSINSYSNLVNVVPSAVKLLLPQLDEDVYLSDPEWYDQLSRNSKFMEKFSREFKPLTILANNKLQLLYDNWHEVHPSLDGYSVLTDQIIKHFG